MTGPWVDPTTGEVLAADEDERAQVRTILAEELAAHVRKAERHAEAARECRRKLALLLQVGEAVPLGAGWAVTVKPGAPARRQVNVQAVQAHAEALQPLGLAPREVTKTEYSGVAAFTSTKARTALAQLGMTPEQFLLAGEPGEPTVVLVRPDEQETT